jgi:transketolase
MKQKINSLKRAILEAACSAKEGHVPSAFSILDILAVLYGRVLRIDPKDPKNQGRDRFVLSKGHGSLALYAVLAEKGFFPISELKRFASFDSPLGGHPDCNKVPGVEASTGSLGHGLPMAIGMALGMRIRKVKKRVFVLVGDQECNEGSIWESALLAFHHQLSNLTCVVDYNHSTDRSLLLGDIAAKFAAFGWSTTTINGHDHQAIYDAMIRTDPNRPIVIVAETIKGFGCKQMENNPAWHHRTPTQDELPVILKELA